MEVITRESISKVNQTEKVLIFGKMENLMMVNGNKD